MFPQKYSVILKALVPPYSVLTSTPNFSQKRLVEYVYFPRAHCSPRRPLTK